MIEFFEDYYAQDKKRVWKDEREDLGAVGLPTSGDPLIDRWEKQISEGINPDLTEGLPEEERKKLKDRVRRVQAAEAARKAAREAEQLEGMFRGTGDIPDIYKTFSDDYRGA